MPTTRMKQSKALTHKHRSAGAKKGRGRSKAGQKIHLRGVSDKE